MNGSRSITDEAGDATTLPPLSVAWLRRFGLHGKPFPFETLGDPHDSLYSEPLDIAGDVLKRMLPSSGGEARFCVGYYVSGAFNAYAAADGEEGLVAISAFVPPIVFTASTAVASRLHGETGDALATLEGRLGTRPRDQPQRTEPVGQVPEAGEAWLDYFRFDTNMTSPQFDWAMRMYLIAMRFLVCHECMHILLGHAGWLRDRRDRQGLFAFAGSGEVPAGALPLDLIEFQADYNAAVSVGRGLLGGRSVDHLQKALGLDDRARAVKLLFRCAVRSLVLLSHCYPSSGLDPFSRRRIHPHPYLRGRSTVLALFAAGREVLPSDLLDMKCDVLQPFAETVALLDVGCEHRWLPYMNEDNHRMKTGGRHSEQLHAWRQRHAKRLATYFYRWAPRFQLDGETVWQPPAGDGGRRR